VRRASPRIIEGVEDDPDLETDLAEKKADLLE
jgi:hypothetical protein